MSKKSIEFYKKLNYDIKIVHEEMDADSWYIAYAVELGKLSCFGRGDSPEEAVKDFILNKNAFIELLYERNEDIPMPIKESDFSGTFNLRTTPEIHKELTVQAKEVGKSLNQYVNFILGKHVYRQDAFKEIDNSLKEKFEEFSNKISIEIVEHDKNVTNLINYNKSRGPNRLEHKLTGINKKQKETQEKR